MMTTSFVTADLAADRYRTLRAEADAYRLARAATAGPTRSATTDRPRRWARLWGGAPAAARPA